MAKYVTTQAVAAAQASRAPRVCPLAPGGNYLSGSEQQMRANSGVPASSTGGAVGGPVRRPLFEKQDVS